MASRTTPKKKKFPKSMEELKPSRKLEPESKPQPSPQVTPEQVEQFFNGVIQKLKQRLSDAEFQVICSAQAMEDAAQRENEYKNTIDQLMAEKAERDAKEDSGESQD